MRDTILTDAERQILDAIYRLEHVGFPEPGQGERPRRISPVPIILLKAVYHTENVDIDAAIATLQTATMIEVAPLRTFPLRRGFRLPDGRTVELRAVKGDGTQADAGTLLSGHFGVLAMVDGVTVAGGAGPAGLGDAVWLTGAGLSEARRDDAEETRADTPAAAEQVDAPARKRRWTQAEVDAAVVKYAESIRRFIRKAKCDVDAGRKGAIQNARRLFGRNTLAKQLQCSGSMISKSEEWREIAKQLRLTGRTPGVGRGERVGLDAAMERKSEAEHRRLAEIERLAGAQIADGAAEKRGKAYPMD